MNPSNLPWLPMSNPFSALKADPVNRPWVVILEVLNKIGLSEMARRFYVALYDYRSRSTRPIHPEVVELSCDSQHQAKLCLLQNIDGRKQTRAKAKQQPLDADDVFVDPQQAQQQENWPACLRDPSHKPPTLHSMLGRAGRPPVDAEPMMRAFILAPLLGMSDSPAAVCKLLHSNSDVAQLCGFTSRGASKIPGEYASRRIPELSTCEQFSEVMSHYGLWNMLSQQLVRENFASGVVQIEQAVAFDTTHVTANSHCGHVVPEQIEPEPGQKAKHRKVPRLRKTCHCGKQQWSSCPHPWVATDQGAAIVVKGATRIYWAHKASVVTLANSEIPIDVRVCRYAAESDGNTLLPHLQLLARHLPEVTDGLRFVLADDGYQGNQQHVSDYGQHAFLVLPVHPKRPNLALAKEFDGITHFTPVGVPVCRQGYRFQWRGRDISDERYIFAAPDDEKAQAVCASCPNRCGLGAGRRHIRVPRRSLPQIDWQHPQLAASHKARYARRSGVERAIKRLKIDLKAAVLSHRGAHRVQAHFDRRLIALHLLLRSHQYD